MNIAELIEELKKYPQHASAVVLFKACSDYSILEADQLKFVAKPRLDASAPHACDMDERFVLRNGQVMRYDPRTWPADEVPEFLSLLIFPGN